MLFNDPAVIDAARAASADHLHGRAPYYSSGAAAVPRILAAAVAALDRDALIERVAQICAAAEFGYEWEGNEDGNFDVLHWRFVAAKSLIAIGLIPEAPKESHDA